MKNNSTLCNFFLKVTLGLGMLCFMLSFQTVTAQSNCSGFAVVVGNWGDASLQRFNGSDGTYEVQLATAVGQKVNSVLQFPTPNGYLYVGGYEEVKVVDAFTGVTQFSFSGGPFSGLTEQIVIGLDGNAYVANEGGGPGSGSIAKYNATTGAYISTFISFPSYQPNGLAQDASGNWYVSTRNSPNEVLMYNSSGVLQGTVTTMGTTQQGGGLKVYNNELYVVTTDNPQTVKVFSLPISGFPATPVRTLATGGSTYVGIGFGPDNNLYMADFYNSRVSVWNPTTGAFVRNLTNASISNPHGVGFTACTFVACTPPANPAIADGSRTGSGTVVANITTACASGSSLKIFSDAGLTTDVTSSFTIGGSSVTSPSISATTTYYAQCINDADASCKSGSDSFILTINAAGCTPPANPAIADGSRTGSGTVVANITTACTSGSSLKIFSDAGLTTDVTSSFTIGGSSVTSPSISATTTYYAQCISTTDGTCKSGSDNFMLTINAACNQSCLFTSSYSQSLVLKFDGSVGGTTSSQSFGSANVQNAYDMAIGPDGMLYVASYSGHSIIKFNPTTGAYLGDFVSSSSGGLLNPTGIIFGPDGNLYVSGSGSNAIHKFDGTTGASLGKFVDNNPVGFIPFQGLEFGPDGNLYSVNDADGSIIKYNGTTGVLMQTFSPTGNGHLQDITFGPDGNLYLVEQANNKVTKWNPTTGTKIGDFISLPGGGTSALTGATFGLDGNFYLAHWDATGGISKYDAAGTYVSEFATVVGPKKILFVCGACTQQTCTPPANPAIADGSRTGSGTVVANITTGCASGSSLKIFSDAGLTTDVTSSFTIGGSSVTSPSISATTTYYAQCVSTTDGTCKSGSDSFILTISAIPCPSPNCGTVSIQKN